MLVFPHVIWERCSSPYMFPIYLLSRPVLVYWQFLSFSAYFLFLFVFDRSSCATSFTCFAALLVFGLISLPLVFNLLQVLINRRRIHRSRTSRPPRDGVMHLLCSASFFFSVAMIPASLCACVCHPRDWGRKRIYSFLFLRE